MEMPWKPCLQERIPRKRPFPRGGTADMHQMRLPGDLKCGNDITENESTSKKCSSIAIFAVENSSIRETRVPWRLYIIG